MQPSSAPAPSWPETDFLVLRYRADLHLLVGRWQRPVSAAEVRQGYQAMLRAACQTKCPYWQLDLRGRNAPDAATRLWLTAEFLPHLAGQPVSPRPVPSSWIGSAPPAASPGRQRLPDDDAERSRSAR